jgi:hypothetical protein
MITEIDLLVQDVRGVVLETSGLFGFVFEVTGDGLTFSRGCPVFGDVQDVALIRDYFKRIGELAIAARKAGENRSIKIEPPAAGCESGGDWYASIVASGLESMACVVVVNEATDGNDADAQLGAVLASLNRRRFRREHLNLDRLRPKLDELRALGCAVYSPTASADQPLRLLCTSSLYATSAERARRIGGSIRKFVTACYMSRSDRIVPPKDQHAPDEEGRRPWHFVLASGPAVDLGYVISVVLLAKDEAEVRVAMAVVQSELSKMGDAAR